jgi:DNA polymerase V
MDDDQQRMGFPNPAQDHAETALNLHLHAVRHPEATYFIRAEGDGMRSVGIFPGDLLVVDRALDPLPGDIVIAIDAGDFVLRHWERGEQEETPDAAGDTQVWGVVAFVLHAPGRRR